MCYPNTVVGRQQLANQLAGRGLKPTQQQHAFDRDKISQMADAMTTGVFDWRASSLEPIIISPSGEVLGGHHRVIAAHLAGVDLNNVPGGFRQVYRYPNAGRPVFAWDVVLPN